MGLQRGVAWRTGAAVLALAGLLAACVSPSANEDPVTLRVVLADDWVDTDVVAGVLAAFEDEYRGDVQLQVHGVPFAQMPEMVLSSLELEQPLDVVQFHAFAAGAAGWAEPVDDLWEAAGLDPDAFLPGALEQVTWDGQRYGVPLDANAMALLVNQEALAAVGYDTDDLATPDGFRAAAAEVVGAAVSDHALTVTASTWAAYGWIRALGGQLLDPDSDPQQPRFTFDDPATVVALEFLADLVQDDLAPRPFAMAVALDALGAFAAGEVAMHVGGSWDLQYRSRAVGPVIEDVAAIRIPQADPAQPRTVLGGSSLLVPAGSEHRELAFELMLRLTSDEAALALAEQEGRLPARTELLSHPRLAGDPLLDTFLAEMAHAEVMPLLAYPAASTAFREAFEAVLAGRQTPAEAMAVAQRAATAGGDG